MVKDSEIMTFY